MNTQEIRELFNRKESEGLVRFTVEPDDMWDIDNLAGDTYNPEVNTDLNPAQLEREYQEFIERVNNEGVWGIVGEYKCSHCDNWKQADSVWGFVGSDWGESGYDTDVMHSALKKAGLLS